MKNNKIKTIVKLSLLTLFVVGGFFGLGFLSEKAQAACIFKITRFDAQGKTTAIPSDTLKFENVVERTGDLADCDKINTNFTIGFKNKWGENDPICWAYNQAPSVFVNGRYSLSCSLNLATFSKERLAETNKIEFYMKASDDSRVLQEAYWTVNITGAATSSGSISMNVYFLPAKATYQASESFKICASLNKTQLNSLNSSITNINFETFVNGTKIGSYGKIRDWYKTNDPCQDVTVNTNSGFKNGTNEIRAELWQSNTTINISRGTATAQIAGLSTTGSGATVSIAPAQSAYKLGDTIQIAFTNLPPGSYDGIIDINGREQPISFPTFSLSISEANGFKAEGANTLTFDITNSSGVPITLSPINLTTSKTGSAATPGATPGSSVTSANCTGPNPDPSRCLYNPLPEDELTTMFLLIVKGFLMIVGIWAVMFIIIGGFRMVMAAGNEEQYIAAKKTITWAVLGVIVAAMSFSLIAIVQNLLQAEPKPLPFEQTQNKLADKNLTSFHIT